MDKTRQTAEYPLHRYRRPGSDIGVDGVYTADGEACQRERDLFPESFRHDGVVLSVEG